MQPANKGLSDAVALELPINGEQTNVNGFVSVIRLITHVRGDVIAVVNGVKTLALGE